MPDPRRLVYWDACVFLDYVNEAGDKMPVLDVLIDRAGPRGDIEIVTSMMSIAEVAFGRLDQTGQGFDPTVEARIDALWTDPIIKLVDIHRIITFQARDLIRTAKLAGQGLSGADAIHLATAQRMQVAEFHTYDTRLFRFSMRFGFPVVEPNTPQRRLPGT
jgi:predicted nucleic acid-binding protein